MIKIPSYIHFTQPGILTTVQDLGRFKLAQYGVPYSGAMDRYSLAQVNFLLQNQKGASVLEMASMGLEMVFERPTRIVFAGAEAEIVYNKKENILNGQILEIQEEDVIKIKNFKKGQWLYMGIQGGFETEEVAGSKSWYPQVTPRDKIKKNDSICYFAEEERFFPAIQPTAKVRSDWYANHLIHVYPGPDWHLLPKLLQNRILKKSFTVSELINRMAYQLKEEISNDLPQILTAPVYPGTIQLTPGGKLIILMRDAQVTGGYPRILQVDNVSLNVLSQKRAGEKIKFSIL